MRPLSQHFQRYWTLVHVSANQQPLFFLYVHDAGSEREEKKNAEKEVTLAYLHPSRRRKTGLINIGAGACPRGRKKDRGRAVNTTHSAVRKCEDWRNTGLRYKL